MKSNKTKRILEISAVLMLAPSLAFAYLDPGTGNILINLLLAGAAAAFFSVKGLFYYLKGKGKKDNTGDNSSIDIAIFSEGKQYWNTFKPVIESLINRGQKFQYYSLDVEDPALTIENDLMESRFLGYGALSGFRFSLIKADALLSTTPNIGTPGYPLRRPAGVGRLIHVFHSINDISVYEKGSLDFYDEVITVGDFQNRSIREIEALRKLPEKKLVPLGLPYLDGLVENKKNAEKTDGVKTVLVGSSWGAKGCLVSYGTGFIRQIARAGYKVIVRPHPQSYKTELHLISRYKDELKDLNNIIWDETISPAESMNEADILVSDTSSIRFDFSFIYEKPVITLNIESDEMPGFERAYLKEIWTDTSSLEIGYVIKRENADQITAMIEKALAEFDPGKISRFRDNTVANFGRSGSVIADYLCKKQEGK